MRASESRSPTEGRIPVRGEVLKAARLGRGLGYAQLSKICKRTDDIGRRHAISITTIKKAEKGGPSYLSTIRALAEALGLEPEELIAGTIPGAVTLDLASPDFPSRMHHDPPPALALPRFQGPPGGGAKPGLVSLSRNMPAVNATVPLFDRRRMEGEYYDPIERGLVSDFGWREERANLARFVLRELMNNGFVHGCRGAGESAVTFSADVEQDGGELVLIVRSPGEGFDVARALRDGLERGGGDGGEPQGRGLFFVKSIARELITSSDGRVIQAHIGREPEVGDRAGIRPTLISFEGGNIAILTIPRIVSSLVYGSSIIDRARLAAIVDEASTIGGIFDMTQCEQIESGPLGGLYSARLVFKRKQKTCLFAVNERIMELFRAARLLDVFESYKSVEDCIRQIIK